MGTSMRAHGRARSAKGCAFPSLAGIDGTQWPHPLSPMVAPFSSFPRDHEGSWVSATRERVVPCGCLPGSIRLHGHRPQGRWGDPSACLPVSMSHDGRPRSRHGYILHAIWLCTSHHIDVRVDWRYVSFSLSRTPIMGHGYSHDSTRMYPSA